MATVNATPGAVRPGATDACLTSHQTVMGTFDAHLTSRDDHSG